MDVVVAGGAGKIGLRLLRLLHQNGHRGRGLIRKEEQTAALRSAGGEPALVDLETVSVPDLAIAIQGADAVVFAAGAGPGSGEERKWTVDYGGAVKLIEAAQHEGIRRYAIVSSMGAADPEATGASGTFAVYLQAKHDADEKLRESGLDYTIVRPGGLTDDAGTGQVSIGRRLDRGEIPRDDVAAVLFAALGADNTIGKDFDLIGGDTPVEDAVGSL
jgi:uncharacterized protein YbjT (DUF2867 family)